MSEIIPQGGGGGAGGGSGRGDIEANLVDLQPHPVYDKLPGISYSVNNPPPWPQAILLGFQHYLVMLGTTVLIPAYFVPLMGGGKEDKAKLIQTLQFVAGVNTLLQTTFGTRLPAVVGVSYTFVAPTISIVMASRYTDIVDTRELFNKTMRGIQGSIIVASPLQIVLGFTGLWGNVLRFLSPLAAVPLVLLSGFGLYDLAFTGVAKCVEISLPHLIILLLFSQYLPRLMWGERRVFDRYAILFSVPIVWSFAHILTALGAYKNRPLESQLSCSTHLAAITKPATWISIPYPFQWGAPTFDAGEVFAMMMASFVALVESTGSYIAVSRYASETPIPPSVLSRGIGWQGVGILLCGMFGTGNAASVSVENVGLLAMTRVGSRRVVQIAAVFMIIFSVVGKFGAVFASIPAPIVAASQCILFAYAGSAGFGLLQFCNTNSFQSIFNLGFSVLMGISVPQYFNMYRVLKTHWPVHTHATWFNDIISVPFSSGPFVAGLFAFFLDVTLSKRDNTTKKDRGVHWWDSFRYFDGDTRSKRFYSLPFNLNRFFPAG